MNVGLSARHIENLCRNLGGLHGLLVEALCCGILGIPLPIILLLASAVLASLTLP